MSEKQVRWLNECACCKHNSVCMYGLQTQEEARTKALQARHIIPYPFEIALSCQCFLSKGST
jgi:hypothetical protein